MSESVLATVDTGADINDAGSSGSAAPAESAEVARAPESGAGTNGQGGSTTSSTGEPAGGTGADAQSPSGGGPKEDGKLVPLSALQEARAELRQLKHEMAELRGQPRLTIEEKQRLSVLEQATAKKDPDFLEDPKGYVDSKLQQATDANKETKDALTKLNDSQRVQTEFTQLISNVGAKEQEFLKATPDYHEALTHVRTVRASQLQLLYPQATAQQIQQQIAIEEVSGARHILQSGGDPAAFAYAYAKTLGYAPKALAAADTGATTAARGQPTIDKDAARSLGGGGGGGGAGTADEDGEGSTMPELQQALAERFGVRKKK